MHREDNSRFLLYIEPNAELKSVEPVDDELSIVMSEALRLSKSGTGSYRSKEHEVFQESHGYKGFHRTECGMVSSNKDYLLENGMITNSLCVYYLRYYREAIPKSEMDKVYKLVEFYKNK